MSRIKYMQHGTYVALGKLKDRSKHVAIAFDFPSVEERARARLADYADQPGDIQEAVLVNQEIVVDAHLWFLRMNETMIDSEVVPLETFRPIVSALNRLVATEV